MTLERVVLYVHFKYLTSQHLIDQAILITTSVVLTLPLFSVVVETRCHGFYQK